ncbi:hypothetical protein SAMN05892883_2191 [Jatrophihabitans sp. GAS493]|uniref:hypothetical protein n=1 Tax=Jatrophihabitans sp. GAS493 TaxID=1907575 RepID=UPI000BB80E3D|nr:hypothetical protein [Jatrophihabitans sp. GAS493]SOD72868.1 hypothetical protein SAMN05892883_2191 [Jatrophihabitans sp. GAS493]
MTTWDEIANAEKAFIRATLRRTAAQQERLFYDATDASAKGQAGRRATALLAAIDQLTAAPPPAPLWREIAPNGRIASDSAAIDRIAHWLCDPEWGLGMLEDIADVITSTGRDLTGAHEPTWARH